MNSVILFGRLVRDPRIRTVKDNLKVAQFSVAPSQGDKDPVFVDVTAFGRSAELIELSFKKGSQILLEGRLKMDQFKDKEGRDRTKLGVILNRFNFVNKKELALEEAIDEDVDDIGF